MWYWIVMFVLAAGSAAMLAVSFSSIKKRNDRAVSVSYTHLTLPTKLEV